MLWYKFNKLIPKIIVQEKQEYKSIQDSVEMIKDKLLCSHKSGVQDSICSFDRNPVLIDMKIHEEIYAQLVQDEISGSSIRPLWVFFIRTLAIRLQIQSCQVQSPNIR